MKIVSLNIEQDRHLDPVIPFLKKEKPDVILLQEVFQKDIAKFENSLGMKSNFTVMKILLCEGNLLPLGLAVFLAYPMTNNSFYYRGNGKNPPIGPAGVPLHVARAMVVSKIIKNQQIFCLINTHFTWTPNGYDNELQREDLPKFLDLLTKFPEFILCGDLNAPRGRIIFDKIASIYKDNVPYNITTTIDKKLHYAGDLQLVVDCLFSTSGYTVMDVEIVENLSDHCAITAVLSLTNLN